LVAVLASPLIAIGVYFAYLNPYVDRNPFPALADFLRFGYLFRADPRYAAAPTGPASWMLITAAVAATVMVLGLARITQAMDPLRTLGVVAIIPVPALLLLGDGLLRRHWRGLVSSDNAAARRELRWFPGRLSVAASVVPIALMTAITPIYPLFAPRRVLLLLPYLLVVAAAGVVALARSDRRWLPLLPAILIVHGLSLWQARDFRPEHHFDYEALTQQLVPKIVPGDLVVVRRWYQMIPVYYYMNWRDYRLVESRDLTAAIRQNPSARVWVLALGEWEVNVPQHFEREVIVPEVTQTALKGYQVQEVVKALRIWAFLYVPPSEALGGDPGLGTPAVPQAGRGAGLEHNQTRHRTV
jgi:hypothetical protein